MKLGKLTLNELDRWVYKYFGKDKKPTIDAGIFGEGYVVAHDPAIGTPIESIGFFAFHYPAADVASKFGIPKHLIVGIYLPTDHRIKDVENIARGIAEESRKYGVDVIAGHTGFYKGIVSPLVASTCIGKVVRHGGRIGVGDKVVQFGVVGIEAMWLKDMTEEGKSDIDYRDLTPLDTILDLHDVDGIKLIHDVGEGGIATALYEVSWEKGIGISISSENLIIHRDMSSYPSDILYAPSYGVVVAIVDKESDLSALPRPFSLIGEVIKDKSLVVDGETVEKVKRTRFDELYGEI